MAIGVVEVVEFANVLVTVGAGAVCADEAVPPIEQAEAVDSTNAVAASDRGVRRTADSVSRPRNWFAHLAKVVGLVTAAAGQADRGFGTG